MAGKGKGKSRTKEQVALYAEIVRLMTTLNQRSEESVALAKKLSEAQGQIPGILAKLTEEANKATKGVKDFNQAQKEDTRNWANNLVSLELSLRRIQNGFNGIKKTALFADSTAEGIFKFNLMAKAIQESGSLLKGLDLAAMKFGVALGEPSRLIETMKLNMASLRWGEGGGGLGQIMEMWGGTFTGYENAKDLLLELRSVAKNNVNPLDYPLFMQKANMSQEMFNWMMSGTDEEFSKMLDDSGIKEWDDAVEASRKIVSAKGKEQAQEQEKLIAQMVALGSVTENAHELMAKWNKFAAENPWVKGVGMGVEVAGNVGSSALAIKALADLFKGGKIFGAAKTAAETANAANTIGTMSKLAGGLGVAGTVAIIAATLFGIAWTTKTICQHAEDNARGKKRGESSKEARDAADKRVQDAQDKLKYETENGTAFSKAKAEKELKEALENQSHITSATSRFDMLESETNRILDKIEKSAFVTDAEWQTLESAKRFPELMEQMKERLGEHAVSPHDYALDARNPGNKQTDYRMLQSAIAHSFGTGMYGDAASLISQLELSKTKEKPWADADILKKFIREGKADALSDSDKSLLAKYLKTSSGGFEFDANIKNWMYSNEFGKKTPEYIKSAIYEKPSAMSGFASDHVKLQDNLKDFQTAAQAVIKSGEDEGRTRNGLPVPNRHESVVDQEWIKFHDEQEKYFPKEKNGVGDEATPPYMKNLMLPFKDWQDGISDIRDSHTRALSKAEGAEERLQLSAARVDEVSDMADSAIAPGGVVNDNSRVSSDYSSKTFAPNVTITNNNTFDVNPTISKGDDAESEVRDMIHGLASSNVYDVVDLFQREFTGQLQEVQETFATDSKS